MHKPILYNSRDPGTPLTPHQDHRQVQCPVKNLCVTWELTTTSGFFHMKAHSCMSHCMFVCCCCLVTKSCLPLCDPLDCNLPGGLHGILQARILEWVAVPFSRGASWPRDCTSVSRTAGRLRSEPPGKPQSPVDFVYLYHMVLGACGFVLPSQDSLLKSAQDFPLSFLKSCSSAGASFPPHTPRPQAPLRASALPRAAMPLSPCPCRLFSGWSQPWAAHGAGGCLPLDLCDGRAVGTCREQGDIPGAGAIGGQEWWSSRQPMVRIKPPELPDLPPKQGPLYCWFLLGGHSLCP